MSDVVDIKYGLEDELKEVLKPFFDDIVAEYVDSVSSAGIASNADGYKERLQRILSDHYSMCVDVFSEDEKDVILPLLVGLIASESNAMASVITDTTNRNIDRATQAANEQAAVSLVEDSEVLSNSDKALIGAAILRNTFNHRTETIALSETQTLSEPTRLTFAQIKAGVATSIGAYVDTSVSKKRLTKEWINRHDDRVRPTHVEAGGQVVDSEDPFTVGGASLMYPRDGSLGVPLEEIINCRCYAIYTTG
jgi:hypothetical protein